MWCPKAYINIGTFRKWMFIHFGNVYNRLMTYKIADLLLANGYILPMESVNGLLVPRIEISNYVTGKEMKNKLGDIDILVYSEYSKILYLIEFKIIK